MSSSLSVTNVQLVSAPSSDRDTGLIGWITITLCNSFGVAGISLRRTRSGRMTLSFPKRVDRYGESHPVVWPINNRTRREIESQVLAALGFDDSINE